MSGKKGVLMRKTVQALREEAVNFYCSDDSVVIYIQGNSVLKRMPVYPGQIKTQIRFQEHGLLFEAGLSLRLNEQNREKQRILEKIASLNFGRVCGGLVYLPDSRELRFRLFRDIENPEKGFRKQELLQCLADVSDELAVGYDAVLNDRADLQQQTKDLLRIREMIREVLAYIKACHYRLPAWAQEMDSEEKADVPKAKAETDDPKYLSAMLDRLLESEEDA